MTEVYFCCGYIYMCKGIFFVNQDFHVFELSLRSHCFKGRGRG